MNEARKIALTLFLLLAIGLVAYAVERLHEIGRRWIALIVASIILLILALTIHYARAHDHARPELDSWFNRLQSGKGLCCSNNDGTALEDVDWETKDGHYRVRIEGEWITVPDDAVVAEPNRAGRTMVWPTFYRGLGAPVRIEIRCFMPGSMT